MKKIIFFVGCFFILINNSWALTLDCPEVASPGEVIKVHIEDDKFNGIKARYKFDSKFIYQNISLSSSWKSYYDGVDGFSVGDVTERDKLFIDVNVKISMDASINREYTMELVDIEGNDPNYDFVNLDNVSCRIKLLSDVNTLDSLVVDGVVLSPKFNKGVVSYEGKTKREKITISAGASDKNAKVEGDIGEQKLNLGLNSFLIKVTSARGSVKEYKIYITRTVDKKSNDVTLKSLTLSEGKLNFKKDNFLYSVDVDYEVNSISVKAIANDDKAKVEIQNLDKLVIGDNTIKVVVTAEDGTTATYVVIVKRKDKLSGDAIINNLNIKNYKLKFNRDIYEYELEIGNEDKLDIEVFLNSDRAKYRINGNDNLDNNSVIEIVVTAEDGSKKVYRINIIKASDIKSSSLNNYIRIVPLIGFIGLIVIALLVKLLRFKYIKN